MGTLYDEILRNSGDLDWWGRLQPRSAIAMIRELKKDKDFVADMMGEENAAAEFINTLLHGRAYGDEPDESVTGYGLEFDFVSDPVETAEALNEDVLARCKAEGRDPKPGELIDMTDRRFEPEIQKFMADDVREALEAQPAAALAAAADRAGVSGGELFAAVQRAEGFDDAE